MPGWYRQFQDVEGLQIVGLIQEQHPERCRLFMQWKQLDFPILVDSLNRIGVYAVPLMWAIDEHGVVQKQRPREDWIKNEFLTTEYPAPTSNPKVEQPSKGVREFLAGNWNAAVGAFTAAVEASDESAELHFRLGCSYRARHDSPDAMDGDFQRAIDEWTRALALNRRNYIFQRRLQQYGPRLMKPYPFYDWIDEAKTAIAARGEAVPELVVALEGSELARQRRRGDELVEATDDVEPDEGDELPVDENELVAFAPVVAPSPTAAGQHARIYLRFTPSDAATWDNEAGRLQVWIREADGFAFSRQLLQSGDATAPSSSETRSLELELGIDASTEPGEHMLEGYAVYFVCTKATGECVELRQDFAIPLEVSKAQPRRRRR